MTSDGRAEKRAWLPVSSTWFKAAGFNSKEVLAFMKENALWTEKELLAELVAQGNEALADGSNPTPLEKAAMLEFKKRFRAQLHGAATIDATLKERGERYGAFDDHARLTQELKAVMRVTSNWTKLSFSQREALEMIANKIGRILNGDPNYHDSWHDIEGYARLVADELLAAKGCDNV